MVWIGRTDNGISRQKLRERFKIDTILYSLLDPGAPVHIKAARDEGVQTGGYYDPSWFGTPRALDMRKKVDELVIKCGLKAGDHLQTDAELVPIEYLQRLIEGSAGNRGLFGSNNAAQPQGTQADKKPSYTNMPFQNHTVVDFSVLAKYGIHWFYQLYYGAMDPADGNAVCLEILRDFRAWAGVNWAEFVHPFYDGARYMPDQRDGAWFTAERLPNIFAAAVRDLAEHEFKAYGRQELRDYYTELAKSA